jgi:uncharacterized Fe-S cluster protein YjdI
VSWSFLYCLSTGSSEEVLYQRRLAGPWISNDAYPIVAANYIIGGRGTCTSGALQRQRNEDLVGLQ